MKKKAGREPESLFGYRLVNRKPRAGVVIAVIVGLVAFFVYFYSLVGKTH